MWLCEGTSEALAKWELIEPSLKITYSAKMSLKIKMPGAVMRDACFRGKPMEIEVSYIDPQKEERQVEIVKFVWIQVHNDPTHL